jgi:hypothetical protein
MLAAVLVVACACAAPPKTIATLQSPTPSPSPTPTAPLQASGPGFHVGEVGVGYAPVALSATGGVAPYKWTVSAGSLPAGLTLSPDGSVSGSPTGAATYVFTIQVADSGNSTATIKGGIEIAPHVTASLLSPCAQYCNVELGCDTVCGVFGTLGGGVAPYSYVVSQGPLPAGTSLSTLSLTGTFGGMSGYLKFTVQVTDALGATSSISPTFWMYPHISLAGGACSGNYGTGCTVNLPISGGVPGSAVSVKLVGVAPNPNQGCWSPTATAPPPNYGLSVISGYVTVSIPKQLINGYGAVWTVAVNDQTLCASGSYCTSPNATVTIGVQCG